MKSERNHDAVLVTLADRNFIDQAKQLFSSAYWNAGWKGDYLLLAHNIPEKELKWFRDKGILVKECKSLYKKETGNYFSGVWRKNYPIYMSIFYLFTPFFKQWKQVIALETDTIIRGSLDKLTKLKGFWARDILTANANLSNQLADGKIPKEISERFDIHRPTFNPGVLVFSTDIIHDETFEKLKDLMKKYRPISSGNEGILNIFFYNIWKRLPLVYNVWPNRFAEVTGIPEKKIEGIILHFIGYPQGVSSLKPWNRDNLFYEEWTQNLQKAEDMDLNKQVQSKKWSGLRIFLESKYIEIKQKRKAK